MYKAFAKAREIASGFRQSLGKKPVATKNASSPQRGSLYIYAPIGDSFWGDTVSAQAVVDALEGFQKDGCTAVDVYVNSEGGSVWDGKAIYEAIVRFKGEKVCHIDGIAASAASFICMAADKIVCSPVGTVMIHDAECLAYGTADDLRAVADVTEMESATIAGLYSRRTGQTVDAVRKMMSAGASNMGTWMNAERAKELGFCDEIRDDGADEDSGEAENVAAPAIIRIAAETQKRIAAANRERLASLSTKLSQSTRASPGARSTSSGQPAQK